VCGGLRSALRTPVRVQHTPMLEQSSPWSREKQRETLQIRHFLTGRAAWARVFFSQAMGVKMVLSGEGADETLGGYLYFHKAPNATEFHKECVRKTTRLHLWDVCRANKSTMAWGVEARTPFLSKKFLDLVMDMDPNDKMINPVRALHSHTPYGGGWQSCWEPVYQLPLTLE
jgi:hypothetical protein